MERLLGASKFQEQVNWKDFSFLLSGFLLMKHGESSISKTCSSSPALQIRVEAAYLYDAVHLYADALINCLENNRDPKNGTEIINAIKGKSYQSAMG